MKTTLIPYLNFDGATTREAMEFYKSIFGGTLTMQTFGDVNMAQNDEQKDYVMHADLTTELFTLYASSGQPDQPTKFGDSVSLSLVGSDEEKLTEYFNKLSEGGEVLMKLEKQFWGDMFGMCRDKFGIQWMANITTNEGMKP